MDDKFVGKIVGSWTVVERVGEGVSRRRDKWQCVCTCGRERQFTEAGVKHLHSRSSCGCLRETYTEVGDVFTNSKGTSAKVIQKLKGGYAALCKYEDGTEQMEREWLDEKLLKAINKDGRLFEIEVYDGNEVYFKCNDIDILKDIMSIKVLKGGKKSKDPFDTSYLIFKKNKSQKILYDTIKALIK